LEGFKHMTDRHIEVRNALLERLAKEVADYLQTRFIEEAQMSAEEKAYWDAETDRLNEIAVRKHGEPLFSRDKEAALPLRLEKYTISRAEDDYSLTFRIFDPEKPIARFQYLFGSRENDTDRA
jgi:SHS2 domain-containing protein